MPIPHDHTSPPLRWRGWLFATFACGVLLAIAASAGAADGRVLFDIPVGDALTDLKGLANAPPETEVDTWGPTSFRILDNGHLVVGDPLSRLVKVFAPPNLLVKALGDPKHVLCRLIGDMCVTPEGQIVYVERTSRVLVRLDLAGHVLAVLDPRTSVALVGPTRIECLRDGRFVVGDEAAGRIHVLGPDFKPLKPPKTLPWSGMGLAVDGRGRIVTITPEGRGERIVGYDERFEPRPAGLIGSLPDAQLHLEAITPAGELVLTEVRKVGKGVRAHWVGTDGRVAQSVEVVDGRFDVGLRVTATGAVCALLSPKPAVPGRYRVVELARPVVPQEPAPASPAPVRSR